MIWDSVHQFVPTLIQGDAIGDYTLWLRTKLLEKSISSEIFVSVENNETQNLTHSFDEMEGLAHCSKNTLLLYHVAQASTCAQFILGRAEPLGLIFHNFTPPEQLINWDGALASDLLSAERELKQLAQRAQIAICDSSYNASKLNGLGLTNTTVVPLPIRINKPLSAVKPLDDPTILFVGRIAPNKAFHDIIAAAALLRTEIPNVKVRFVGDTSFASYYSYLTKLVSQLALEDVVTFTGRVTETQLANEYLSAQVFCCLSDHEGFGVPILEAMKLGLPVIAYNAAAVPETLGSAGLLINNKSPAMVATAIERVITDQNLSKSMIAAGKQRASIFSESNTASKFFSAINSLGDYEN